MLRFFIKSSKFQKLSQKTGSFKKDFRLRPLLCPMSHALIFWQMKGFINLNNRGKFYEYSIFDCWVINFQSFSYQFSIHWMAPFGEVLDPYSPKYCQVLLKFSPQVVFNETKTVLQESLKIFYRNRRYPEFAVLVKLLPVSSPWKK